MAAPPPDPLEAVLSLEKRRLRVVEAASLRWSHPCSYLPGLEATREDRVYAQMSPEGYEALLRAGFRRFGRLYFRPRCRACDRCLSLRILVRRFALGRRWRRVLEANEGVRAEVGPFRADRAAVEVADAFYAARGAEKGWEPSAPLSLAEYRESFGGGLRPQEVRYFLGDRLVGVGIFDDLSDGETAIIFHWRPEWRRASPGTFNILWLVRRALERGTPHVYLGYYVPGSRSMEYKALFRPAEILRGGAWTELGEAPPPLAPQGGGP